ncbi:Transposon Ty3-I Gag-Pol polyprotein [Gossypium australe]|uniref:Transposon Ty3-I Gag-Pol polyprotein n=1 Tax=Gossypium australe TaxID=47621 RepID=A0A5B6V9I8_9ROSI|nr:Transposon Ty3-I Gag-Pol polyprotein [Gossypium australe]
MFTCPFDTYAFKRILFGLCNASTTFTRCMTAIFADMMEESLVKPTWCSSGKISFYGKKGFVLGHQISRKELEVDKAKIEVVKKLPNPTTV